MKFLEFAFSYIGSASQNIFALLAFSITVIAWLLLALKVKRNKNLLASLGKLPPNDRLAALQAEFGNISFGSNIDPKTWLRNRVYFYYLIGFFILCISVFLILFIKNSHQPREQLTYSTSGNESPIVANNSAPVNIDYSTSISGSALLNKFSEEQKRKLHQTSIVYHGKWEGSFATPITATVNGQTYEVISAKESGCYTVENQQDFDGNGSTDALVKVITACGGNCCANSYFFISYHGGGHFQVSKSFGDTWGDAKIEQWKDLTSVVITSHNEGVNQYDAEETITRYVLDSGKAIKVEESARRNISAIKELKSSEFDFDSNSQILKIIFDLNNDGISDAIYGKLWHRWGRILWSADLSGVGSIQKQGDANCKRIGILASKTNGVHDLVCDHDTVLRYSKKHRTWVEGSS